MTCIPIPNGIICVGPIDADTRDLDMRTRSGQEEASLRHLRANGGKVDIFWCTENQRRAWALNRLEKAGRIRIVGNDVFPVVRFEIEEER